MLLSLALVLNRDVMLNPSAKLRINSVKHLLFYVAKRQILRPEFILEQSEGPQDDRSLSVNHFCKRQ